MQSEPTHSFKPQKPNTTQRQGTNSYLEIFLQVLDQQKMASANSFQTTQCETKQVAPEPHGQLEPVEPSLTKVQRIITLLRQPAFELPQHTRADYFDVVAFVATRNPGLVKKVQEICIVKNQQADYEKNFYEYESVIGGLIEDSSLQKLTLHQFDCLEIIDITGRLKSQTGLHYLNLENNELDDDGLGLVMRCLPRGTTPLTLELRDNYLSDIDTIALMVSMRDNVRVLRIGRQRDPKSRAIRSLDVEELKTRLKLYHHPELEVV